MAALPPSPEPSVAPATQATPQAADLARGLTRKIAIAAVFGGLVFAGLALYGDVTKLRKVAMSFSPSAVGLGFGLAATNYGIRIWRWQYYLRCIDVSVPLFESSIVFLSGFVMSVTPGKVGEVFKSLLLYESRGVSMLRTAPIVVAERLTDLIALVLLTAIGSLAFEHGVAIAAGGAVVVSGMVAVCAYRPLGEALFDFAERFSALTKIVHKLREAYEALLTMLRPGPLLIGTLMAFMAWGLECCSLYAIAHGFPHVNLSWDAAVFAYSASTIIGALMMLPGGLGGTETAMITLLQTLGGNTMSKEVATAATVLVRLATLWFAVGVGMIALAVYRARQRASSAARSGA
jgi:uncharacterized protein (TIRG00374 family)